MRMPIRKTDKYNRQKPDPNITQAKFNELKNNLERLKRARPKISEEVKLLSEGGDFSENAGYQSAKGRLRGLNQKITEIEDMLSRAIIINTTKNPQMVQIGNTVVIEATGIQKTYLILGSSESRPGEGIISHHSPIGSALLGRKIGDVVRIKLASKTIEYKIIKIV